MASALETAKETYRRKKARLTNKTSGALTQPPLPQPNEFGSEPGIEIEATARDNVQSEVEGLSLAARRTRRHNRRLPQRYRDEQPTAPPSLPPSFEQPPSAVVPSHCSPYIPCLANPVRQILKSGCNVFGLFRQYHAVSFPAHDPDAELEPTNLLELASDNAEDATAAPASLFQPYPNQNAFLLGEWYWNGGVQKTKEDFKKLLDIVCGQAFNPADVRDVSWDTLNERLGDSADSEDMWFDEPDAGWTETPITLSIPFQKFQNSRNAGLHDYTFPPFRHRSIVSVLKEKMANLHDFRHFHLEPYELRWERDAALGTESVRVYGELYTSPAFLEAHEKIQESSGEPGCSLPRVLIGLMFGSDATHLTSFGSAFLYPCYMYFGNESKYRRCKPTCNLCNHIAYFNKLPPEFKDFATSKSGIKGPSAKLITHCQRELIHAQWRVLLDDEFLEAYKHGVVIECCDGIKRRFYLRIFAYSADYPEKVILSGIRNMGKCPCPRCAIHISKLHLVGTASDKASRSSLVRVDDKRYRALIEGARRHIYKSNEVVNSKHVEDLLKSEALVPTTNAFSQKLCRFGFDLFSIFLVDFMHEVELGVWKNVFIHLLRMLECSQVNGINEMDERFRQVPTFGRDSIRRFSSSVSELKKLGARDYENLLQASQFPRSTMCVTETNSLQCSIPALEGLLKNPQHDKSLLDLLFTFAHWHALAKLRQHTDLSLPILESTTIALGKALRDFQNEICPLYSTRELKREASARERQAAKKSTPNDSVSRGVGATMAADTASSMDNTPLSAPIAGETAAHPPKAKAAGRQCKMLNLNTYKNHSLGDYVEVIRRNGTVDSYSTEAMELEHRSPKSRYLRTSRKKFEKQLSQIERRQARIRRIRRKFTEAGRARTTLTQEIGPESSACEYHIGKTQNHPVDLLPFTQKSQSDPAAKDFIKKLKEHLLPRIRARLRLPTGSNDLAQEAQTSVLLKDNRAYNHKLARFYHTTYDVRRSEDIINPRTPHCNIMLISELESNDATGLSDIPLVHPFLYARVIGIYHVNTIYVGSGMVGYEPMRFDFLHVRWFQLDSHSGWSSKRLDRLSFPEITDEDAFGFVDPSLVLRGCHLIPQFSLKKCHSDGIGFSPISRDEQDWKSYYVNRFADRDMVMRYHWGLGIGHTYAHGHDLRSEQDTIPPPVYENEEIEIQDQQVPAAANTDFGHAVAEGQTGDDLIECGFDGYEDSDVELGDGGIGSSESEEDYSEGDDSDSDYIELHETYH